MVNTVHIVDDDEGIRDSLKELVESIGLKAKLYVGGIEFLQKFARQDEGCILIDVRMPGMSGMELQEELNRQDVMNPVIIMTGHGDIKMAVQAMKKGAIDFLQKPFRDQELIDSILKASNIAIANRKQGELKSELESKVNSLSAREREVVDRVLDGKTNKEIAKELQLSNRTVEIHRSHAMHKLGVASLAELVKCMLQMEESE